MWVSPKSSFICTNYLSDVPLIWKTSTQSLQSLMILTCQTHSAKVIGILWESNPNYENFFCSEKKWREIDKLSEKKRTTTPWFFESIFSTWSNKWAFYERSLVVFPPFSCYFATFCLYFVCCYFLWRRGGRGCCFLCLSKKKLSRLSRMAESKGAITLV